jgi:hypothetical protein
VLLSLGQLDYMILKRIPEQELQKKTRLRRRERMQLGWRHCVSEKRIVDIYRALMGAEEPCEGILKARGQPSYLW